MNWPEAVAEGCTYFPQLLVWRRKETTEVRTEVGKRVKRNSTQICVWDFLLIPFPTCPAPRPLHLLKMIYNTEQVGTSEHRVHPPSPSKFAPFWFEGFSSYEDILLLTLLLGVTYSVGKTESSSSSEVCNYDRHRWEINKQMRETNTPCVPFDAFLIYHWERCEKVDHVRHRGLKECVANRFSPRPYFAGLFRALQAPCSVASNS